METIIIKDDIVTITKHIVETIDLKPLKDEMASLKAIKAPSDKEVLEMAKQGIIHPYYEYNKDRITFLENELAKFKLK